MKTERPYRIRFHLSQGANFMKWQVKDVRTNEVSFYEPSKVNIRMTDCFLRNQKSTAKKINEGANKTVCAWVEAVEVEVTKKLVTVTKGHHLSYNPRVAPNWAISNEDSMWHGENIDGHEFNAIVSSDRKLFSFGIKHQ